MHGVMEAARHRARRRQGPLRFNPDAACARWPPRGVGTQGFVIGQRRDARLRRGPNTGLWLSTGAAKELVSTKGVWPLNGCAPLGVVMTSPSHDPQWQEQSAPRTVLVVEDDILFRLATAEYLRECGYTVYEAGNVSEAQAVFGAGLQVDVVFSDVQMPGALDGFGLARWVRANHPAVPVILTSGVARLATDAADLCEQAPFVEKPYDHGAIAQRIRALLATRDGAPK